MTILSTGAARCAPESALAEAESAVHEAEAAVRSARQHQALWTTAEQALSQAREALAAGDYRAAMAAAKQASAQARLGLEQTGYGDFTWLIEEAP